MRSPFHGESRTVLGTLALSAFVLTACATTQVATPAPLATASASSPAEPTASSDTPVTTYLDDGTSLADPVDNTGTVSINGKSYPHTLGAEFCPPLDNRTWEYNLSRGYRTFEATIGLDDESNSQAVVRFEVFGDNQPLFTRDVSFGPSFDISAPVQNVLRLRLVTTPLSQPGCSGTKPRWGNARIEGVTGEVPTTN